jgi:hypothetical protein
MKGISFIRDNNSGMTLNYRLPVITGFLIMVFLISAGCTQTAPAPQVPGPAPTTGAAVMENPRLQQ